jgi:uncharacterized protein (DUF1778 family)
VAFAPSKPKNTKPKPVGLYVPETYSGVSAWKEGIIMSEAKSARINVRLSPESLETIKAAASVQQQDLTSFVLGAVMERARAVLVEDRLLRLTPHEVNQLERALDSEPEVVPQLQAFIRRIAESSETVPS